MICHTVSQPYKIGGKSCYPLYDATSTFTQFQSLTLAKGMLKIL
jgi:hypothetical protein